MLRPTLTQTLLSLALLPSAVLAAQSHSTTFPSAGRTVTCDIFDSTLQQPPTLILLHGSSGPGAPLYREQAIFFSRHGFRVLLPHYFDASPSHTPSDENYSRWATAVDDLVQRTVTDTARRPVVLVGYSLGASVALAAGSQGTPVAAIAEWYGSLPDTFFYRFKAMPPLLILHGAEDTNIPVANAQQLIRLCSVKELACESHIYPNQAHGFVDSDLADADQRTLSFFRHPATAPRDPDSSQAH